MMQTGTRKKSTQVLIHELDDVISEYVRRSHADEKGFCKCVSCDTKQRWQDMDCCHYKDRHHMGTRFELLNLAVGCRICNRYDKDNHIEKFKEYLITIGGQELVNRLDRQARSLTKWMPYELQDLINKYKVEIAKLKK